MNPVAFELGPLDVRWYGIFVALGFFLGFSFVSWLGPKRGIEREDVADFVLWGMLGGLFGARAFYVVQNWSQFAAAPLEMIRIDHGGLVYYGGLFGACLAVIVTCRVKKLPVWTVGDLLVLALPLGHAVGRIGCFLNGCCFGWPYNGPCAVEYPPATGVLQVQKAAGLAELHAHEALAVFPVQLVAALMNLALFGVLLLIAPRLARRGQLVGAYLVLYGVGRFAVEFGRGDYVQRVGIFTPAQVFCFFVAPAGVALFFALGKYGDARQAGQDT